MKHAGYLAVLAMGLLLNPQSVSAIDFFFLPDSSYGQIGDTVLLSGHIGASDPLRGFTIYLYNDTNVIDLAEAPVPGGLIAARQGLDFRYADHIPAGPNWIEVGATVFSSDFWAGPGELFTIRFVLRQCGDYALNASVGFRRPDGTYIAGTFNVPVFLVCDRIPESPLQLTITYSQSDSVFFYWNPVLYDTMGRSLLVSPQYRISSQQILPVVLPLEVISVQADTFYSRPIPTGMQTIYSVSAQTP